MSVFKERVELLRAKMKKYGMDAYVIPTSDSHQSEYVSDYFKFRGYISGFTGSAGTVVVFKDEAGLWTDGRYYIQAEKQLEGSGIDLFRAADDGVPSYEEYIAKKIPNGVIGFDGKVVGLQEGKSIAAKAPNATIKFDVDLSKEVWEGRPALSAEPVSRLVVELAGESAQDKIARMREAMKKMGADVHLLSSLTDIAWLFNIRGGDVLNTPVVLSYAALTMDEVHLFLNPAVL
ncbi:MAG: aminopeptidase P family N-terminal domain-containing protein, partial [Clostridia bacterium]|nr:aminopeptidase P family N-terminal domain-containing protein [Clostridia bacterium]